jgi:hypothetical protein
MGKIMYKIYRKIKENNEYKNTSWTAEGGKFTLYISTMQEIFQDIPVEVINTENYTSIHKDKKDKATKKRILDSDLNYPILILRFKGVDKVIDGHHRLSKAKLTGDTLKGKVLDIVKDIDKIMKSKDFADIKKEEDIINIFKEIFF